jgi:hypothetical protein
MALGLCLSGLSDPPVARGEILAGALPPLSFSVQQGHQINAFYRQGKVAAHIVLDSGPNRTPRLVVAFPAGNSGVGLWFKAQAPDTVWNPVEKVEPVSRTAEGGGQLRGVRAELSINTPSLTVQQSLLGSVRILRNYQDNGEVPEGVIAKPKIDGSTVT